MPVADSIKWYDKATGEPADGYVTPSDAQEAIKQIYLDLASVASVLALTTRVDGHDTKVAGLVSQVTALASPGELKPPVPTEPDLPDTGNSDGDIRITLDDGHMHVWVTDQWTDIGPVATDKLPDGGNTGDIITWDGTIGQWIAVEPLLSQLHDVDGTVIPNDGDILRWDAARQLWVMDVVPAPKATTQHRDAVQDYTSTPPALTAGDDDNGKLYIAKTPATGAWAGKDDHVMQWNGTTWIDLGMPAVGDARFDVTGGKILKWAPLPAGWHDLLAEFLPLTGGTLTGPLTINAATGVPLTVGPWKTGNAPAAVVMNIGDWEIRPNGGVASSLGIGMQAGSRFTAATLGSIAIGNLAMRFGTGSDNVCVGSDTLSAAGNASKMVAFGRAAAAKQTSGSDSVSVGYYADLKRTSGAQNVAVGANASNRIMSGNRCVSIGNNANGDNLFGTAWPTAVTDAIAIGSSSLAAPDAIAIGSNAAAGTAKTVQLHPNNMTAVKVYAGVDRLISLTELKAVVAASADFNAFKTAIAALT